MIYIFRLFNGIIDEENIGEVYKYILYFCPLLYDKNSEIPNSIEESYSRFIEKMKKIEGKNNIEKNESLLINDIISLLKGNKFFIYESLLRLYDIIHKYSVKVNISKSNKNKCSAAKFKLIYFMSYLKFQIKDEQFLEIVDIFMNLKK